MVPTIQDDVPNNAHDPWIHFWHEASEVAIPEKQQAVSTTECKVVLST